MKREVTEFLTLNDKRGRAMFRLVRWNDGVCSFGFVTKNNNKLEFTDITEEMYAALAPMSIEYCRDREAAE